MLIYVYVAASAVGATSILYLLLMIIRQRCARNQLKSFYANVPIQRYVDYTNLNCFADEVLHRLDRNLEASALATSSISPGMHTIQAKVNVHQSPDSREIRIKRLETLV